MSEDARQVTKRAMFTVNNPTIADCETLYNLGNSDKIKYLVYGAEHADDPAKTPHFQGFVIFSKATKCSSVCGLLGGRAWVGFPKREDPSARCANYCKKEGFYYEFGRLAGSRNADDDELSAKEMKRRAIEWLDNKENKYVRMQDLPGYLLMTPGFLQAWTARRKTLLGPDRNMTFITIVGPTACGKSYAVHNQFPDHAKCFYGNSGAWFANGDAPVLLFEEFNGQIPLQKFLTLLDHYPFQLEEKGGMCPALYTTVIITSNISPDHWYNNFLKDAKAKEEAMRLGISLEEMEKKWNESKKALFDRIGFRTNYRGTGHYAEWQHSGVVDPYTEKLAMRQEIWDWLKSIRLGPPSVEDQHEMEREEDMPLPAAVDDDDDFEPPAQRVHSDEDDDMFGEHFMSPPLY